MKQTQSTHASRPSSARGQTQGHKTANPAHTDANPGQAQEMSKHLGRANDQARDGKERRASSPNSR